MLWMAADPKGYSAPIWMTYRQAQELGGQVRKGEQGTAVAYADKLSKTETAASGEEVEREIFFMKHYTVFNVEQVDGLPPHFYATAAPQISPLARLERAEAFFTALGTDVRHGGNRAFYAIEPDFVQMPPFESFRDPESYYATLGHECIHWTRHPPASPVSSGASDGVTKAMRRRSSSPRWVPPSSPPTSASTSNPARITPPISHRGSTC